MQIVLKYGDKILETDLTKQVMLNRIVAALRSNKKTIKVPVGNSIKNIKVKDITEFGGDYAG